MVVQLTHDSKHAGVDVSVNSPVTNWPAVLGVPCLLPGLHHPILNWIRKMDGFKDGENKQI